MQNPLACKAVLFLGHLQRACFGGREGLLDELAKASVLKHLGRSGGGASRRGDGVAKRFGSFLAIGKEHRCAEERVDSQSISQGFVETRLNTRITKCGGEFKHVGGAATTEGGDGVEIDLIHFMVVAKRAECVFNDLAVFVGKLAKRGKGA